MIFTELGENEYRNYLNGHKLKSYLQTPEMAKLKELNGWQKYYVGVKEKGKICCATMMISYKGKLGKIFSAPRGYLIDFLDFKLLEFFTLQLKKYIKSKGGYLLNIEPKILYKQRDIDSNLVEGGFDNSKVYDNLVKLGYVHGGFYKQLDLTKQVRWAFVLNISNKTEDEIFSGFKPNTRNIIRKSIKCGIKVRELQYDELEEFEKIVESSGSRKNFHSRSLEYYQQMYKLFYPKKAIKFLVSQIDLDEYIKVLKEEKQECQLKIDKINSNDRKRQELLSQIDVTNEKISEALSLQKEYGNNPIMAGGMFILYGDETIYLFSGTKSEFLPFKSQFLIQWEIIKYGINNKYKTHNFYGINGTINKDDNRYGVYKFKRSFGGNVIEYIGDFDLTISPVKYRIHKLISKF